MRKPMNPIGSSLLSKNSKMPGWSWDLPPVKTCPTAKRSMLAFGQEAVCSTCYAVGGQGRTSTVQRAREARLRWTLEALQSDWVDVMVAWIRWASRKEPYFRIHGSGDFFRADYVEAWWQVATALPGVRFWAPTREWANPRVLPALQRLAQVVTVRPSALKVGDLPPQVPGLAAGTTVVWRVGDYGRVCPAQHGTGCDDHGCRSCWDAPTQAKAYVWHGDIQFRRDTLTLREA